MKQYLELVRDICDNGSYKCDRTGTGTLSVFGRQMRFNLADGFPLVTAKHTHLKSIIHELLWFLQGETNIRYLKANGVRIWDEWVKEGTAEYQDLTLKERSGMVAMKGQEVLDKWVDHIRELRGDFFEGMVELTDEITEKHHLFLDTLGIPRQKLIAGELGPVYGSQWRSWPDPQPLRNALTQIAALPSVQEDEGHGIASDALKEHGIDQIANLIEMIKKNPDSRRLIVSAWNPAEVDSMALPPCHCLFQFYSNFLSLDELVDVIYKAGKKSEYLQSVRTTELETDDAVYDHALLFCQEHDLPRRKLSCQLYQRKHNCALVA